MAVVVALLASGCADGPVAAPSTPPHVGPTRGIGAPHHLVPDPPRMAAVGQPVDLVTPGAGIGSGTDPGQRVTVTVAHVVDPATSLGLPTGPGTLPELHNGEHWLAFELRITNDAGQPLSLLTGGPHDTVLRVQAAGGLDPGSIDSGLESVDFSDCPGLGVAAEDQLPVGSTLTGCLGIRLASTSASITLDASVADDVGQVSKPPVRWLLRGS